MRFKEKYDIFRYNMNKETMPDSISATRNSEIREMIAGPIDGITRKLHEALPDLTANDITVLGVIGTGIGGAIAAMRHGDHSTGDKALTALSLITIIASQLGDALDGSLARLIRDENHGNVNPNGQLFDAGSDRIGELLLSITRAISANERHDSLGTVAALAAAVTSPWPSTARARAESKGIAVPETGKGAMGIIGTRVGRAFFGILATEFPEIKSIPVQVIADALTTTASIITTAQRLKTTKNDNPTLPIETQNEAKKRLKLLGAISAVSVLTAGVTYALLRKK